MTDGYDLDELRKYVPRLVRELEEVRAERDELTRMLNRLALPSGRQARANPDDEVD